MLMLAVPGIARADAILPAEDVFSLDVARDGEDGLRLTITAKANTYIYRDSIAASIDGAPKAVITPPGEFKDDPTFGRVEIYHDEIVARASGVPGKGMLEFQYQVCSQQGVCYFPITKLVDLQTLETSDIRKRPSGL